ncbi:F0F1 ATP synthase subunit gamma [Alkalibacter rhizosphaerae]|uniref:F0F1 ATP synthase subunit gamma n=1 Tax=Alkalibacter rhizosphaerae TaxID=2815577 RepID=A0A975AHE6_9FIRM|nr:FoF1 ATP synthase subunit gamma [Alkalibacter rhizosphaerae]QSX08539.1 F0F1 ATP synthase subunit gamma [Alkalibacter rhizosphaerae]
MQTLQALQKSIHSAENLKSIVRTMKAHASSNILQFQQAAKASMDYRQVLDMALYIALVEEDSLVNEEESGSSGIVLHVVFGSDHGLAGRFNERMANYAVSQIGSNEKNRVIVIGQQVFRRLESIQQIHQLLSVPQTTDGITSIVQQVLMEMDAIGAGNGLNRVWLHYGKPLGHAGFEEESALLFPVDLSSFDTRKMNWKSKTLPTFTMDREVLLSELVRQYIFITLYRSFCYSLVSENTSRIESMTTAEKNIDERLEDLQFHYRSQRQNGITEEINDVISGFKSIRKSKEKKKDEDDVKA